MCVIVSIDIMMYCVYYVYVFMYHGLYSIACYNPAPGCYMIINNFPLMSDNVSEIPRGRKRMMELMMSVALNPPVDPQKIKSLSEATRQWHLRFLRSPAQFIAEKNSTRVGGVQFTVNRLQVCLCLHGAPVNTQCFVIFSRYVFVTFSQLRLRVWTVYRVCKSLLANNDAYNRHLSPKAVFVYRLLDIVFVLGNEPIDF